MPRSSILLLALVPFPAFGATLTVGPTGTYATINAALAVANNGDVVEVEPGDYAETLRIDNLDVTITGTGGATVTTISGSGATNSVWVLNGSNVHMTGFELVPNTLRAVRVTGGSSLVATDLMAIGFDAGPLGAADGDGAAVECVDSSLSVTASWFESNRGDDGGHVKLDNCDATLDDVDLYNGVATDDGGAIRVEDSVLAIINSRFVGNDASSEGGAIWSSTATFIDVTGSEFVGNSAGGLGGAIRNGGAGGGVSADLSLVDTVFLDNSGTLGGAIYSRTTGDTAISTSHFENNTATTSNGGAIRDFHEGAVLFQLTDNTFVGNQAVDLGGAVVIASATGVVQGEYELSGNKFTGNAADRGGGLTIQDATSIVAIANTFCGNTTGTSGGGLRVTNAGTVRNVWTNNVFIENSSVVGGGVAYFDSPPNAFNPPAQFTNNTFTGNSATDGGNIYVDAATATWVNNIVANAVSGGGMYASSTAGTRDYNLWFNNVPSDTTGVLTAGDLGPNAVFADPMFAGYSQDGVCGNDLLTLDPASPAIDAGDPNILDNDGSTSDIGAFGGPGVPAGATDDNDGDGWPGVADCDDADPLVNPNAVEVCDGIDNNCDGGVDDALAVGAVDWYPDRDADGYGADALVETQCDAPQPGWINVGGDCNDNDPLTNPLASEVCDGFDNDCNGVIDDGMTTIYYLDRDGDGFGDPNTSFETCFAAPPGMIDVGDDCDDNNDQINPDATEICDQLDNNCDGNIDEGLTTTWYADIDGDGHGDPNQSTDTCDTQPPNTSATSDDCDDNNDAVYPGAVEVCDGIDNNCDTGVDEGLITTWYRDADADGFGTSDLATDDCVQPSGYVAQDGDCDDTNPGVNPGIEDTSKDGIDQDCSGADGTEFAEEGVKVTGECGCDNATGTGAAGWLGLLGALGMIRRRR